MAPSAINFVPETNTANFSKIDFINKHGFDTNVSSLTAKALVEHMLKERVAKVDVNTCEAGGEDAFYVADLGEVYRQHLRWKMNLRRVKPFYAVKCNPDPELLRLLAKMGTGFDCASKAEIETVLKMGIEPSRIIYAHPCKTKSYLRYARKVGVNKMTFDNTDELYKIKDCHPDAELVLRIQTDDSSSLCRLSVKYGASLDSTEELLGLAKDLGLNVIGVSFHVGSGASDPGAFAKSISDARSVFGLAESFGFKMDFLDIGGGFVDETFEMFSGSINEALEEHFPQNVTVVGEPGRYYASNAFTLATNVIARREVPGEQPGEKSYMIYLNDGVYGNFSNIIFDHQHPIPQVLHTNSATNELTEYSIWGPTCDGIDIITARHLLPAVLDIGDWLFFENMGAYTKCSATKFNGFTDDHEVIYISSEPGASALLGY